MTVRTEEELAEAIKNDEETIEIEGDFKNKVLKIKATGKAAWIIAIGAVGVAVAGIMLAPASGGTSTAVSALAAPAAVGIWGTAATLSAISIAIAAGGVGVLNKLRKYNIIENTDEKLVLKNINSLW